MSRHFASALTAAVVTTILLTSAATGGASAPGQQPPTNLTPPVIAGTAVVGTTLTASTGTWSGKALKYAYQWLRCDSTGGSCSAVSGANATSYALPSADAGATLRVLVTATNRNGSGAATSAATAPVGSVPAPSPPAPTAPDSTPPSATSPPTITGTPQQGQTLTASTGSWSGTTPMTYTYQWQRCDSSGASCTPINAATASSYVLVSGDVGSTVRVSVTATNSVGSAIAASAPTAVVSALPCSNPADPITGRWYSCASTFNTPLPSNPPIHPNSATFVNGIVTDQTSAGYSPMSLDVQPDATGYATASTPNVTVQLNFPSCNTRTYQVPIPSTLNPAQVGESHGLVMVPDGTEWDLYKLTKPGVTPLPEGGIQCPANSNWQAMIVAHHTPGWQGTSYDSTDTIGFRATKIAAGAGLIRKVDMQMPVGSTWAHALAIDLVNTSSGAVYPKFVSPARAGDGRNATSQGIPEGARLQLDPSINCNTWPSLASAPEWKRMVCRTMEVYGAVVVDTGRGFPTEFGYDQWGGLAGASPTDNHMPAELTAHLRVINWNLWSGT